MSYFSDNVPTIYINTWPLSATLFDGEIAGGAVPTLFASDEVAALTASAQTQPRLTGTSTS